MDKRELELKVQQLLDEAAESGFVLCSMVPQGETLQSGDDIFVAEATKKG